MKKKNGFEFVVGVITWVIVSCVLFAFFSAVADMLIGLFSTAFTTLNGFIALLMLLAFFIHTFIGKKKLGTMKKSYK